MIQLRRNPLIAIALQLVGGLTLGVGLFLSEYWLVVAGVVQFGAGALFLLNPAVTIETEEVVLKNILSMPRVSYPHDGLGSLSIVEGKLLIRHQGKQAIVHRVSKARLHPGDWQRFEETLAQIQSNTTKQGPKK
jgi:hypothetical protein